MKIEKKLLFFLLFVPTLAELICGASPPVEFFNPITFTAFVFLYGCGSLLIREAKVRWDLQYGVMYLAIAYGIIEEGILVKSFFNTRWVDLQVLSGYGMFLGTQWPWTIMLTIFHGSVSTLIPIALADYMWPEMKKTPILKRKGYCIAGWCLLFITILGMLTAGPGEGGEGTPYFPHPMMLVISYLAVLILILYAYKSSHRKVEAKNKIFSPISFFLVGFAFQLANLLLPNICANLKLPSLLTIALQLAFAFVILKFILKQIYNVKKTKEHVVSFVLGSIFVYVLIGIMAEMNQGIYGMMTVGVVTLISIVFWSFRVLRFGSENV